MDLKYRNESLDPSFCRVDVPSFRLNADLSDELSDAEKEPIELYLRIRNRTPDEVHSQVPMIEYEVIGDKQLLLKPTQSAHSRLAVCKHRFTFTKIFNREANQEEIFKSTTSHIINEFLNGHNRLIFNYGVTNAGKTYTMQGNSNEPGIIPRSLESLFHSLSGKLSIEPKFKPQDSTIVKLGSRDVLKENKFKADLLKLQDSTIFLNCTNMTSNGSLSSQADSSYSSVSTENASILNIGEQCSIWVSFIEIYSEQIVDLFSYAATKNRKILKLRQTENGSSFVQGVTEINVSSPEEAYRLLLVGRQVLKQAATKLNHSSSRSHAIFSIKTIKTYDDNLSTARINQLSFCDLAGSERYSKTQNVGERLKEAAVINSSLLVLGKCINLLKKNQSLNHDNASMIPFRESKLTKILKDFLTGFGKASMIINISPCADMFDETFHVLKFSAKTKELSLPTYNTLLKNNRVSKSTISIFRQSLMESRASIPWESSELESMVSTEETVDESMEEISKELSEALEIIEILRDEVETLNKEKLQQEMELREELCNNFAKQLEETEDYYRDRIVEEQENAEEMTNERIKYYKECLRNKKCDICEENKTKEMIDQTTQCQLEDVSAIGQIDQSTQYEEEIMEENLIIKRDSSSNEKEDDKSITVPEKETSMFIEEEVPAREEKNSISADIPIDEAREQPILNNSIKEEPIFAKPDDITEDDLSAEISNCEGQEIVNETSLKLSSDSDSNTETSKKNRQSLYFSVYGSSASSAENISKSRKSFPKFDDSATEVVQNKALDAVMNLETKLDEHFAEVKQLIMDRLIKQEEKKTVQLMNTSQNTTPMPAPKRSLDPITKEKIDVLSQANGDMKAELVLLQEKIRQLEKENEEMKSAQKNGSNFEAENSHDQEAFRKTRSVKKRKATPMSKKQLLDDFSDDDSTESPSKSKMKKCKRTLYPSSTKPLPASKKANKPLLVYDDSEDEISDTPPRPKTRVHLRRYNTMVESLSPLKSPDEPKAKSNVHHKVLRNLRQRK